MARLLKRKPKRVLIDVDTQYDLIYAEQDNHPDLLRRFRRLIAWARVNRIPVISTALARRSADVVPLSGKTLLCVEETPGQRKIPHTLLPRRIMFGPENRLDLPRHILRDYQQVIFQKRTMDPFEQPRADRLLSGLQADEIIVFGMGVDRAVKATVLGLLGRRKPVAVVEDAIDIDLRREAKLALRQMEAKGARMTTTAALAGESILTGKVMVRQSRRAAAV